MTAKSEKELLERAAILEKQNITLEKQNTLLRSHVGWTGSYQSNGMGLLQDLVKTKMEIRQLLKEAKDGLAKIESKVIRQGKKNGWHTILSNKTLMVTLCIGIIFLITLILQNVGFPVNEAVRGVLGASGN